jgi:integrase
MKNGAYPIQICVGYGTNLYLSTGISVCINEWDARTLLVVKRKDAKRLNSVLSYQLQQVQYRILDLTEKGKFHQYTKKQLKQMLSNLDLDEPTVDVPTLGLVYEQWMQTSMGKVTARHRGDMFHKLSKFCNPYTTKFEDVSYRWLTEFNDFLRQEGYAINTIAGCIGHFRSLFNYAIDTDITTAYPFRRFKIKTEDTPMRVIPVDKLREILKANLDDRMTEMRDYFMISFYLIGINPVDLSALTYDNVVGDRIEYRRAKTKKLYSIKIVDELKVLLEKYKGERALLKWFDNQDKLKGYRKLGRTLLHFLGPRKIINGKEVCHVKNGKPIYDPIFPKLTMYYARYSWATYAAEIDIPRDTISEALGHSYGARVTSVYVKFNKYKVDEANRKVIDYVFEGLE